MTHHLIQLLIHWGVIVFSLWVASALFQGLKFSNAQALFVSALLLGVANAFVRPILVFFTLPLTVLTLGLFLLVINALMIMLVSAVVHGFRVSGFWTAFFASIFISVFSFIVEKFIPGGGMVFVPIHPGAPMTMI
ncbi:putative membrane protein [Novimethylophilus kurashikiensis]|uniref:Putative membrane protein n=1 Tax=Novimethylophilus kurashikiensis TaxID=1825523 RepID=A0A2R5F899_9PROT|nr:phage holin family protein [Novimethylophilus kurashikiensis]GBG13133.1 putative membrane protein [Novimethylophilus kurashikiensis]